jgi:hypothetical protein
VLQSNFLKRQKILRFTKDFFLKLSDAMKNHDSQCAACRRSLCTCIHCAYDWDLKKAKPMPGSAGRIRSILLTPYPPGIALLIPGERFNKTIVDYLKFACDFNEKFSARMRNHCLTRPTQWRSTFVDLH